MIKSWNYECKISIAHISVSSSGGKFEEVYNLYSSPDMRNVYKVLKRKNFKGTERLEEMGEDCKIIF